MYTVQNKYRHQTQTKAIWALIAFVGVLVVVDIIHILHWHDCLSGNTASLKIWENARSSSAKHFDDPPTPTPQKKEKKEPPNPQECRMHINLQRKGDAYMRR